MTIFFNKPDANAPRSAHLHNYFLFEQVSNCNLLHFPVKSIPGFCNRLFSLRPSIFIPSFNFLIFSSDQLKFFAIIFSLAQFKSKFDLNQGPIRAYLNFNYFVAKTWNCTQKLWYFFIGLCLEIIICLTPLSTDIETIYKEATPSPPSSLLNTPGPTQSTTFFFFFKERINLH